MLETNLEDGWAGSFRRLKIEMEEVMQKVTSFKYCPCRITIGDKNGYHDFVRPDGGIYFTSREDLSNHAEQLKKAFTAFGVDEVFVVRKTTNKAAKAALEIKEVKDDISSTVASPS